MQPLPARRQLVLGVLLFSQLLIWLDNTILNAVSETLTDPVRGLGATMDQIQWATGAYTLVFATLMFTAGSLGDRFGHRAVLLSGMAVFGGSSLCAAYSSSAGQLIAARAVMGLGSALIMPATLAILSWAFPGPDRARALGMFSAVSGLGIAAGPLLSGALLARFWWGSVFLVNIPVVLLSLVGIIAFVPDFRSPTRRRLDLAGMLLSTLGLAALAYGLIRAGQLASFAPVSVWSTVGAGLVLLTAFVLVELRLKEPSFNPRLLRQVRFAGGNLALALLFFSISGAGLYGAFYLQGARGLSALSAGMVMLPAPVGVMIGPYLTTRLSRHLPVRLITSVALAVVAVCVGLYGLYGLTTPIFYNSLVAAVQGVSIGMVIAPVTGSILAALPLERAGAGSAVNSTVRQTGAVLGIAVIGTVMTIVYRNAIAPTAATVPAPLRARVRSSADIARHIATATHRPAIRSAADHAFIHAVHAAALCPMAATLVGAVVLYLTSGERHPQPTPSVSPTKVAEAVEA